MCNCTHEHEHFVLHLRGDYFDVEPNQTQMFIRHSFLLDYIYKGLGETIGIMLYFSLVTTLAQF